MTRSRVLALIATVVVGAAGVGVALAAVPGTPTGPASGPASAAARDDAAVPTRGPNTFMSDGEALADLKRVAGQFVERVGTWQSTVLPDPQAQVEAAGYPGALVTTARPLFEAWAPEVVTEVVYPQMGGLTPTTASVIVLARQEIRVAETVGVRDVTLDVRLRIEGRRWVVSSVIDPPRPSGPPVRAGGATSGGRALLASARIELPDAVRYDIATRRLGDRTLAIVQELARGYEIELQVAASGHPGTVFPSTRLSNHAVGRAVDVRSINGVRVADIRRDDPLLATFMVEAARAGATEVGGPIAVEGRGFFTDEVHQDHIHVGHTPGKPPAVADSS